LSYIIRRSKTIL